MPSIPPAQNRAEYATHFGMRVNTHKKTHTKICNWFEKRIQQGLCPRCMIAMKVINVHGHTQCPVCHCVIDDCCQGELAVNTNLDPLSNSN